MLHLNLSADLSQAKPIIYIRRLCGGHRHFATARAFFEAAASQSVFVFLLFLLIQRNTYEYRGLVPNKYWPIMFVAALSFKRREVKIKEKRILITLAPVFANIG